MKGPWVDNLGYSELGNCIKILEQESLHVGSIVVGWLQCIAVTFYHNVVCAAGP